MKEEMADESDSARDGDLVRDFDFSLSTVGWGVVCLTVVTALLTCCNGVDGMQEGQVKLPSRLVYSPSLFVPSIIPVVL